MINNVILQHKLEKEKFIANTYIAREKLKLIEKFINTDLIKVIIGPRRSGKSVFSLLSLKNKNFAYLNFDDENLLQIKNYDEILKGIYEIYDNPKFILFDEIQNLPKWEIFINKLQRRGYNLILTGSNANLLSKELSTVLIGRYISIELLPFSFKEYLQAKNFDINKQYFELPDYSGKILNHLNEYIKNGGFPEIIVKNLETKIYLDTLFDAIIFKDAVKRYNVRFSQKIYKLAMYLISNYSNEFSYTRLKNILNFNSTLTLQKYMKYLEEAYVIFSLNRFSFKIKEQIKTPKKLYLIDTGLISAKSFQFSQDIGKKMENMVFLEILRRGKKLNNELFYYKTRNQKEVDFVLREGIKNSELIQVSYELNYEIEKREISALNEASDELKCDNLNIITWDIEKEEKYKSKKIKFIPLWKWLIAN